MLTGGSRVSAGEEKYKGTVSVFLAGLRLTLALLGWTGPFGPFPFSSLFFVLVHFPFSVFLFSL
jgi:hypothetical protein